VIQGSDRPSFLFEALAEAFGGNFDGDVAAKAVIVRSIHWPIPPLPIGATIS
jgi:hypothetical protein